MPDTTAVGQALVPDLADPLGGFASSLQAGSLPELSGTPEATSSDFNVGADMPMSTSAQQQITFAGERVASELAQGLERMRRPPAAPLPDADIAVSKSWDGYVTRVDDGYFEVRFRAIDRQEPTLVGEFAIENVEADERELVRPGALLYVYAGKVRVSGKRWRRWNWMQFRRVPPVTERQAEDAIQWARDQRRRLGIEAG